MTDSDYDPGRRQLLASAVLPGLERLLQPLSRKADSYTEWFSAVQADDANRCRQLLLRGFDPNTPEPERVDTALILAVRYKSWKVFELLLGTQGTNLDARSRNGDTAIMVAAFNSETVAVRKLLARGAEINRPEWTALHYAATAGSVPIVRLLLEHSAYIDAESPNKTTPLMMAARGGHEKVVRLLLDEGADVALKNELGLDAIDFARSQKHDAIVSLLQQQLARSEASRNAAKRAADSRPDTAAHAPVDEAGAEADAVAVPAGDSAEQTQDAQ